ncbi:BNR repeat-containing protein [Marinimicrobium sp. C2-29]|uniref:BNR repeat-containing protein n=1 Tax=Marinimicrobium sp. C2-29 TaxID=3139825 RepID=UPI003138B382
MVPTSITSSVHRLVGIGLVLTLTACGILALQDKGQAPQTFGARQIPIDDAAFSGSSINVVAGTRQMLYTHGNHQYAGYYGPEGRVMLAQRQLGEDQWSVQKTEFSTNTADAHNTISLIVDGEGYLHLAWGHHDSPLNYSVSVSPHSLTMGEPTEMVGLAEERVTYPQFFQIGSGNLLFLYRDGASGRGRVVLNHYDVESREWTRRQDNLIDGEGERSAYWDMAIGADDTLHLAWVWRESPDVATNHDLLYAESSNGGKTWRRRGGGEYQLPVTRDTAEIAYEIVQNSNLMNPPVVAVSNQGAPFITSYWSETAGEAPGFHVVHHTAGEWEFIAGPQAKEHFTLAGGGTKNPPISRPALLVEKQADRLHLVYRSDHHGGRVLGATLADLSETKWTHGYLTEHSVGAWEPSIDPAQWRRAGQAHMLLQDVVQVDGDDSVGKQQEATPIRLLLWHPE